MPGHLVTGSVYAHVRIHSTRCPDVYPLVLFLHFFHSLTTEGVHGETWTSRTSSVSGFSRPASGVWWPLVWLSRRLWRCAWKTNWSIPSANGCPTSSSMRCSLHSWCSLFPWPNSPTTSGKTHVNSSKSVVVDLSYEYWEWYCYALTAADRFNVWSIVDTNKRRSAIKHRF